MQRLFPTASKDDADLAAEVDALVRSDLTTQRLDALEQLEATIDEDRLSREELESWLAVCNDLRLILGTRLDLTEESGPHDFTGEDGHTFGVYRFLTSIVSDMIEALSGITELKLAPDVIRAERQREEER